jgi:hypothetical protein
MPTRRRAHPRKACNDHCNGRIDKKPPAQQTYHGARSTIHPIPDVAYCRAPHPSADRVNQELDGVAFDLLVPAVNMPLKVAAGQDRTRPGQERPQEREFRAVSGRSRLDARLTASPGHSIAY